MERRSLAAVIIAVAQGRGDTRQQRGQARLALDERPGANILAVEFLAASFPAVDYGAACSR